MIENFKSIKVKNYKGIGTEKYEGFDKILPINLVIGKNNVGKSSLVDILKLTWENEWSYVSNQFDEILLEVVITEDIFKEALEKSNLYNERDLNFSGFRKQVVNSTFYMPIAKKKYGTSTHSAFKVEYKENYNKHMSTNNGQKNYLPELESIVRHINGYLNKISVISLNAERDINPEIDNKDLILQPNGIGATNLVHKYIHKEGADQTLIENKLLDSLNEIMNPDTYFERIVVQQVAEDPEIRWEIFLDEKGGKRISLSNSGSGLKTIILVLLNLIVVPDVKKQAANNIIFIFEEIENNLHPSLQRNLFSFIKNWRDTYGCYVFITTHSHIPIELFSTSNEAQMLHVQKREQGVVATSVIDNETSKAAVDDLGIKASDILQSNGIIWVEGPTDRIYINRWIDLYTNKKLIENRDYQILFYGGKNLSHLSAEQKSEDREMIENINKSFINLLKANKNCAIVIDSDKDKQRGRINGTKSRIKKEMENINSLCWITEGREIENYLPESLLKEYFNKNNNAVFDKYDKIEDFLKRLNNAKTKNYYSPKMPKAIKFSERLTYNNMLDQEDWKSQMDKLIEEICKWNHYKKEDYVRK